MPDFTDRAYLTSDQYRDSGNLDARMLLHQRFSTNSYGWFQWVYDQLSMPAEALILEIGCGSGALWSNNLSRLREDWHIVLSDLSPGMLSVCRGKLRSMSSQFAFALCDASGLPFPPESFEAVIANHMLYHVPDRRRALQEIARVLKPAGVLYAATNGAKHLVELDAFLFETGNDADGGLLSAKPSSYFSLENGAQQLDPWFTKVELRIYEDALAVTESEPLLAYIRSMLPRGGDHSGSSTEPNLETVINERIAREGCFRIQKSSGLFIARKREGIDE